MKDSNIEYTRCPFCKSEVEINVEWAKKNGKVFCGECCKSFDIRIEEETETPETEEPVRKPEKDDYDYW